MVPSLSICSDPENAGATTFPLKTEPVNVATIESFIENTSSERFRPVPAEYIFPALELTITWPFEEVRTFTEPVPTRYRVAPSESI